MKYSLALLVVLATMVVACGTETAEEVNPLEPRVMGLTYLEESNGQAKPAMVSHLEVTVGQTVYVVGENFLDLAEGRTELVFDGTFQRDSDGKFEHTNFVVTPLYEGEVLEDSEVEGNPVQAGMEILRLSRFGPFQVPFTVNGDETGTFSGTLTARNVLQSGAVYESGKPVDVSIVVRPSIIIRKMEPFVGFKEDLTPVYAECGAPAIRALQNLPYVMEVEAVGFEPEFFIYEFAGINGDVTNQVKYTHQAKGKTDSVGDPQSGELVVFTDVPEDVSFYYAAIRVTATVKGQSGDFVETALPLSVHRPIEFHLGQSKSMVAQRYEPVPVSGCIKGGIGTEVTYAESHSESRQNAVSVGVTTSWSSAHGVTQQDSWSEGVSESTSISNSSSDNWSQSESESLGESYGVSYNHSDSQDASFSSTNGEDWGYSYNEGTDNQEMQATMGEIYGEVSSSVNVEVGAEGGVPGFGKVSGKVGTTVGASVGGKTGQTVGQTNGKHTDAGSSMGGNKSQTEGYGSTTTDSMGESMSQSYALTTQNQVGGTDTQTEAKSTSKVYNYGSSVGMSDVVTQGDQESWTETWSSTTTDQTLLSFSNRIPMNRYGVFYRQTTRNIRRAQIYSHNLCGVRELMGEMVFNEWTWAPELALGDICEGANAPASSMKAECVIPPCN